VVNLNISERSFEKIQLHHLQRLLRLAKIDRLDLFSRKPELAELYGSGVLCVALCQGAAQHYRDGHHGVKDFDVWTFYQSDRRRPFPYRRVAQADFGTADFGRHPHSPNYIGRRVDLIGRSIPHKESSLPIKSLEAYLTAGATKSAVLLAARPVVLLHPEMGRVLLSNRPQTKP
jgi:hypothetical protein